MVLYAAQGDQARAMALLWRSAGDAAPTPAPARGPRPRTSVDEVVAAAVALADADGMDAVSMRAVAERLGVTAMALYTYVPSKRELLDLMYDATMAELARDADDATGRPDAVDDWRAALTAWAERLWAFYLRHPWVVQVSQARPVLGPHEYEVLEGLMRIMRGTGLPAAEVRRAVGALYHLVRGAAQTATESRASQRATGVSEDEWWYARSALLLELAPDFAERFPTVTAFEQEGAFSLEDPSAGYLEQEAAESFRAGLALLLEGMAARAREVEGRRAAAVSPPP